VCTSGRSEENIANFTERYFGARGSLTREGSESDVGGIKIETRKPALSRGRTRPLCTREIRPEKRRGEDTTRARARARGRSRGDSTVRINVFLFRSDHSEPSRSIPLLAEGARPPLLRMAPSYFLSFSFFFFSFFLFFVINRPRSGF